MLDKILDIIMTILPFLGGIVRSVKKWRRKSKSSANW